MDLGVQGIRRKQYTLILEKMGHYEVKWIEMNGLRIGFTSGILLASL
jgi:hypothetical protein